MKEIVIVAAKRTAIGQFLGSLTGFKASDLASVVIKDLLQGIDPDTVNEVILGQVLQAGAGQNPARQAAIKAGIGEQVPAISINKLCGSGMKSIHYAFQSIALGEADMIIAGGMENMSATGHYLPNSRLGQRLGHWQSIDLMLNDGLTCALSNGIHMGITAENLAAQYNLSRQQQDEFALASQHKASKAAKEGRFDSQISAVEIPQRNKDSIVFKQDEFIRHEANSASMQKARPAFKKEGTVTAANASGVNDGAAAVIVTSAAKAKQLGLKPLVRVVGFGVAGVDPTIMGIGPVNATRNCLNRIGWSIDELDLIESNEAFAAQSLAVNAELGWDTNRVNVNGGAIALGHPIGASGARIVTSLIHEMLHSGKKKGLATMCIGGGQGIASAYELID